MSVFLKFICIYFFLYYRGPCVRKLFTGLIMYLPSQNKEHCIVLYCIVLYCSISLNGDCGLLTAMGTWTGEGLCAQGFVKSGLGCILVRQYIITCNCCYLRLNPFFISCRIFFMYFSEKNVKKYSQISCFSGRYKRVSPRSV